MKLSRKILAGFSALMLAGSAVAAHAESLKVGMITTLSGGGAGLGIDVRDGFLLAVKQSGEDIEVVVEDDQRKPDIAVQLADRMIQSEKVDVLTGIIWSNLAMAVVPAAVRQGKNSICLQMRVLLHWQAKAAMRTTSMWLGRMTICLRVLGHIQLQLDIRTVFVLAPNYPAGKDMITGYKREFKGNIANEVYTQLGQKDYAAEIAQIRASDADSVFFFLPGGMGISFMKQYAASGVDKPLVGPCILV